MTDLQLGLYQDLGLELGPQVILGRPHILYFLSFVYHCAAC